MNLLFNILKPISFCFCWEEGKEWIFTYCVNLDKFLNVLGLSFLICEMRRLGYIILVSSQVLKLHDSVLEIMEP